MDSFVKNKLKTWNLNQYIKIFTDNEISQNNFHLLTKDTIAELIPKIGPRTVFITEFQKFQNANMEGDEQMILNDIGLLSLCAPKQTLPITADESKIDSSLYLMNIRRILFQSLEGKHLLELLDSGKPLLEEHKNNFTRLIANIIVKTYNPRPTMKVKQEIIKAIIEQFPNLCHKEIENVQRENSDNNISTMTEQCEVPEISSYAICSYPNIFEISSDAETENEINCINSNKSQSIKQKPEPKNDSDDNTINSEKRDSSKQNFSLSRISDNPQSSNQDSTKFDIREILNRTPSGRFLLELLDQKRMNIDYIYKLSRILTTELITKFGLFPPRDVKENLAAEIVKQFPYLQDEDGGYQSWFSRGKNHTPARGYIEERLRNCRKKCRKRNDIDNEEGISEHKKTKVDNKSDSSKDNMSSHSEQSNTLKEQKISKVDTQEKEEDIEVNRIDDNDDDSEINEICFVSYDDYFKLQNKIENLEKQLKEEKELRQKFEKKLKITKEIIKKRCRPALKKDEYEQIS